MSTTEKAKATASSLFAKTKTELFRTTQKVATIPYFDLNIDAGNGQTWKSGTNRRYPVQSGKNVAYSTELLNH
jgi:hypothetical protein